MKRLTIALLLCAAILGAQVATSNPPADTNYLPNDGSTGTTTGYWLVMNASGNAVLAGTAVASGVRGLCVTGCGTTGMAGFISRGVWPGTLDNSGVAGDWVIPSSSAAGKGHDTGSATRPTSGPVYGQVQGAAPGGMYYVALDPPDTVAIPSGGDMLKSTYDAANVGGQLLKDAGSNGIPARTSAGTTAARTITAGNGGVNIANGDGVSGNPTISATRGFGAAFDGGGSALTAGSTTISGEVTIPYACTIAAWSAGVDAGTATFKVLRVATGGTTTPAIGNSINTSGVGVSSGTHVRSTTVSDFTSTTVSANDVIRINLAAVTGSPTLASFGVTCQ